MPPGARPARRPALRTAAAALGVLCLAACGLTSPPTSGASPRPTLSLPVPSGSPGAGLPERTIPAPTISARPEPTATPAATEPPATAPPATAEPATAPAATEAPTATPAATEPPTATPAATAAPTATPAATASPEASSTSSAPGWWLFVTGVVAGLLHRSPAPAPATGTTAPADTSTSISPWWWLLVAAIVMALAVGGALLWRRRKRRKTWSDEMAHVTTELRWADEQLIPGMLAARTVAEFTRAWSGGRPRLVAADQQLFGLARRTPDEPSAASIAELRDAIAGLLRAVDAEAALTSMASEELRTARAEVERARSRFAAALDAAEGKPKPASPEPVAPA
jgi:hypothetical protein